MHEPAGHVAIEEGKFHTLIGKMTDLIDKIRKWYVDRTDKKVRVVTVSHDVWDGNRKKINRLSLFFHSSRNP